MRERREMKENCEPKLVVAFESKLGHFYVSLHARGSAM